MQEFDGKNEIFVYFYLHILENFTVFSSNVEGRKGIKSDSNTTRIGTA